MVREGIHIRLQRADDDIWWRDFQESGRRILSERITLKSKGDKEFYQSLKEHNPFLIKMFRSTRIFTIKYIKYTMVLEDP